MNDQNLSHDTMQEAQRPRRENLVSMIFDYLEIFVFSVCAVLVIFTLVGRLCSVSGSSMRNTLFNGEVLVTTSLVEPKPGDIIVFHHTTPTVDRFNEPMVKRVIATAGQTVRIDYVTGEVRVDGTVLEEPYIALLNKAGTEIGMWTQAPNHDFDQSTGIFEATVPDGCYFVMGDNRNNSADSRMVEVGYVDTRRVLGKVVVRLNPFTVYN